MNKSEEVLRAMGYDKISTFNYDSVVEMMELTRKQCELEFKNKQ